MHFRWNSGTEALLLSETGEALQGLTAGFRSGPREEYVLPRSVVGGERILLFVEMACNDLLPSHDLLLGGPLLGGLLGGCPLPAPTSCPWLRSRSMTGASSQSVVHVVTLQPVSCSQEPAASQTVSCSRIWTAAPSALVAERRQAEGCLTAAPSALVAERRQAEGCLMAAPSALVAGRRQAEGCLTAVCLVIATCYCST
eukprot:SAG31_NODE_10153_length_1177_cov_1.456401_2_plen_198_part_01